MYKAIHFDGKKTLVDSRRYLGRHDIVYKRPALKGYEGLPIGNGFAGGLLYHTSNSLEFVLNHTDAIDFAPDGHMKAWAWEAEEKNTAPVSCANISIHSSLPCFDWIYLEKFEERLDLARACIIGKAITPFSEWNWKSYAVNSPNVLLFEVEVLQTEEVELTINIEKWSSPNFFHHYEQVVRIFDKNLDKTQASSKDNYTVIEQDLGRCKVATVSYVMGEEVKVENTNSHCCRYRFPKKKKHSFQLLVSTVTSEEKEEVTNLAMNEIFKAIKEKQLFQKHVDEWEKFWGRSFVHLGKEDYIENLYYINLYQLNSCSRGKYPITFSGIWSWFKDSRNWGHFYHWNHQQTYWCIDASNHPELADNYFEYRFKMLPQAIKDAKEFFGVEGAFYSDVSNLNGYNAIEPDTMRNFSVGAQIAMGFYQHYQYIQDETFLRKKAIPVMLACADFYSNVLVEEGGQLVIRGGATAYESYWNLKETLTDYVAIHTLIRAILKIESETGIALDKIENYKQIAEKLYSYGTELVIHNGDSLEIFSVGKKWDDECVKYCEGEYPLSPFPASLITPIYPSGLIGLSDKERVEFLLARNTARVILDNEVYQLGKLGCSGHAPTPQMAARLGMCDDIRKVLHHFATTYQIFPNGLMHFSDISKSQQWDYMDNPRMLEINVESTNWEEMHEKKTGNRTKIDSEWFLHCYFESAANLTAGINEMLLQSHDDIIRIFPAADNVDSIQFTLLATRGFQVSSEKVEGVIRYLFIESKLGKECRLENPWKGKKVAILCENQQIEYKADYDVISFDTGKGKNYILYPNEYPLDNYYKCAYTYFNNDEVKEFETSTIGLKAIY